MPYANNKDADQSAHPCSLMSSFIVHCLDSVIFVVAISEVWRLLLAFVAEQASLSLTWSQTQKTGFLVKWIFWQSPRVLSQYTNLVTSGHSWQTIDYKIDKSDQIMTS